MLVRLTVKLAEVVNGLDLSRHREGDLLDVTARDGQMLLAEGWAETVDAETDRRFHDGPQRRPGLAADRGRRRARD